MTEWKHQAYICLISLTTCVLVGMGRESIHPRHVAVRTAMQTSDDHPCQNKRSPSLSEWWKRTEGQINFYHCCPLRLCSFPCHSSKITVISPPLEGKVWVGFCYHYLNLNPHLYIGKVFSLTSVPAASPFPTFSLRKCPSSLLSASAGLGGRVYPVWYFHIVAQVGITSVLGMLWKCHCLVELCFMIQFLQRQWFLSPSEAFCFVCVESRTVNKW